MSYYKHYFNQLIVCAFAKIQVKQLAICVLSFCLPFALCNGQSGSFTYDPSGNLSRQATANQGPPVISGQPSGKVIELGGSASFSVVVVDAASVTYQWKFKGNNITGARADSLFLANVSNANEGSYTVTVTNGNGSVTSAPAWLYIDSDSDGLADSWETRYFGNLVQNPNGDFDRDGVSNFDEFADGTNPANAASYFPRLKLIYANGSVVASPALPKYSIGQTVTLTATPYSGNSFFGWSGDLTTTATKTTIVMNTSKTVFADFDVSQIKGWGLDASGQTSRPVGLDNVLAVAAGDAHTLALKSDGKVVAWGDNTYGQSTVPASLSNVVAIAAGTWHSLALKSNGTVVTWGGANGSETTAPSGLNSVVAIAAGWYHSLALKSDGTVVAWGGDPNNDGLTQIPRGLGDVIAIAAGYRHNLALMADGTVQPWGNDEQGQCSGAQGAVKIAAIAAGRLHSLALKSDGKAIYWGYPGYGPYSGGDNTVPPAALTDVVAIGASLGNPTWFYTSFNIALKRDGTVVEWGDNLYGEMIPPHYLRHVIQVSAGGFHSLALMDIEPNTKLPIILPPRSVLAGLKPFTFRIRAKNHPTSYGVVGRLPNGLNVNSTSGVISGTPTQIGTFPVTLSARNSAGSANSTLQLTVNPPISRPTSGPTGTAYAGSNFTYQITGSNNPTSFDATGLPPGLNVNKQTGLISGVPGAAGLFTATIFTTNSYGTASATLMINGRTLVNSGDNSHGQTDVPIGLNNVVAVSTGNFHTLALKSNGTVVGWGDNSSGQTNIPAGLANVAAIANGASYSLALKSDKTVVGWGDNSNGQINIPPGLTNVVGIAAGAYHALALKSDGTILGWGLNSNGQIDIPVGLSNVVAIAAAGSHSAALKSNGTVVAWGDDTYGQSKVPAGLINVVAIGAGFYHTLALKSDGTVVAWGYDGNRQTDVPAGLSNVVAIAVGSGSTHNVAMRSDGSVIEWGSGSGAVPAVLNRPIAIADGNSHSIELASWEPGVATPIIVSSRFALGGLNPFKYQILAKNLPTSFAATGLPAGLSLNSGTGLINGTPTIRGTFNATITVTNGSGSSQMPLTLFIN